MYDIYCPGLSSVSDVKSHNVGYVFNVSFSSCAGELGRGEERTKVVDGVCPTPGTCLTTSPSPNSRLAKAPNCCWCCPHPGPAASGVMSVDVPSSSDGSGSRAGASLSHRLRLKALKTRLRAYLSGGRSDGTGNLHDVARLCLCQL